MTRSTAIVKVAREACPQSGEDGHRCTPGGIRYVARCRDCGWEDVAHTRVILDGAGIGKAQRHRVACPAMNGGAS